MKGIIIFQGKYSEDFNGTLIRYETSNTNEGRINCTYLPHPTATENSVLSYPWSSFKRSKMLEVR